MKQREATAKTDADRKALAAERDAILKARADAANELEAAQRARGRAEAAELVAMKQREGAAKTDAERRGSQRNVTR